MLENWAAPVPTSLQGGKWLGGHRVRHEAQSLFATLHWSHQTCCDWLKTSWKLGVIPLWGWFWIAPGFQVCRGGAQLRQISFCCHSEQLKLHWFFKSTWTRHWRESLPMIQQPVISRKAELPGFVNQLCQEGPEFAPVIPQVFTAVPLQAVSPAHSMNPTGSAQGGSQRGGNGQEMREWLLGWQLWTQHWLTDRHWPYPCIHNTPQKPHPHMQIKIILTGKERTPHMREAPDL